MFTKQHDPDSRDPQSVSVFRIFAVFNSYHRQEVETSRIFQNFSKIFNRVFLQLLTLVLISYFFTACNSTNTDRNDKEVYVWSHNDYEQPRPLETALELGFQMIEADIHLIDGDLYVIHDHPEDPDTTPILQDLYLDPLTERINRLGGEVLSESNLLFYLVIDVKTEAESTFEMLSEVLEPYRELFTRKENGIWIEGPINLLISGNRPVLDEQDPDRVAFIDGRIPDIGRGYSPELYPVISDNWNNYFTWDGTGDIPEDEYDRLVSFVRDVHEEDKLIRFWATPDNENVWSTLIDAGVDIINVDDLRGMREYLDEAGYH